MVRLLAPVRIRGTFGKALSFDGVDDYVEVGDDPTLRPDVFSVSLFLYIPERPKEHEVHFLEKIDGWNNKGYLLVMWYGDDLFRWRIQNATTGDYVGFSYNQYYGKWTHIVGIYKDRHLEIYANGELKNSKDIAFDIEHSLQPLRIGIPESKVNVTYKIDEVRIYNRALSAEEIIQLFRGGHVWKGLVLWLRFDEGSGTTAGDSSGCGNHGTIYGATWTNGAMILRKPVR